MLNKIGNFIRMLVRPAVTGALVGTMCYLALWGDRDVVLAVVTLGGVAVNAWFGDRAQQRKTAADGDK